MIIEERYELGKLLTFELNKRLPIHNWFECKESFSRDFVWFMLNEFDLRRGKRILDPFCGSGTTLLACKEKGISSIGVDSDPLFVFVARSKSHDYSIENLKEISREIFSKEIKAQSVENVPLLLKRAFSKYALEALLFYESEITGMEEPVPRDFFSLAFIVAAMRCSYAVKDGVLIRFVKKPLPPFRRVFKAIVKRFLRHLKKAKFRPCQCEVRQGDARRLGSYFERESFDAVITSPPYLNKLEYITSFDVERALLRMLTKTEPPKTYFGLNTENVMDVFPELNLPPLAKAYFSDMRLCLSEINAVLKAGGQVAMAIGQGVFPEEERIVESDVLTARLAEMAGFDALKLIVARSRTATRDRTIKIGAANESVLILKKV